jgi:hypothetical protein
VSTRSFCFGVSVSPCAELELLGDVSVLGELTAALGEAADARLLRLIGRVAVWTASRSAVQALCDHAAVERSPLVAAEALAILREPLAWLRPLRAVVGDLDPAPLLHLAGANHPLVRAVAIDGMWWLPADVAWPVLSRNVSVAALRAAVLLGGDRLPAFLTAATDHPDKDVVTAAACALLDTVGVEALPVIRGVAPRMERWALCQALAKHGEAADVPIRRNGGRASGRPGCCGWATRGSSSAPRRQR